MTKTLKYAAVFAYTGDGVFISFPDFKDGTTATVKGEDFDKEAADYLYSLREFADDEPMPEPSDITTVDVQAAIRDYMDGVNAGELARPTRIEIKYVETEWDGE